MEAAALYTFARATGARVLCLAHVTNTMGQAGQDFEKGEADGTADALRVLEAREHAEALGYTVVDPSTVITTHLTELIKDNMSELLSHAEADREFTFFMKKK